MLLLAPALLVFIWQTLRPIPAPTRRTVYGGGALALLLLCLLAPLLFYLYIPPTPPAAAYYQIPLGPGETLALYDATFAGFIAHVTGSSFGGAANRRTDAGADCGAVEPFHRRILAARRAARPGRAALDVRKPGATAQPGDAPARADLPGRHWLQPGLRHRRYPRLLHPRVPGLEPVGRTRCQRTGTAPGSRARRFPHPPGGRR